MPRDSVALNHGIELESLKGDAPAAASKKRLFPTDMTRHRLIADGIPAGNITVAWAGENIPLEFEHAGEFLKNRDIIITTDAEDDNADDPSRRRVEYEINGNALQEKYSGRFCRVTAEYAAVPCKP